MNKVEDQLSIGDVVIYTNEYYKDSPVAGIITDIYVDTKTKKANEYYTSADNSSFKPQDVIEVVRRNNKAYVIPQPKLKVGELFVANCGERTNLYKVHEVETILNEEGYTHQYHCGPKDAFGNDIKWSEPFDESDVTAWKQ